MWLLRELRDACGRLRRGVSERERSGGGSTQSRLPCGFKFTKFDFGLCARPKVLTEETPRRTSRKRNIKRSTPLPRLSPAPSCVVARAPALRST